MADDELLYRDDSGLGLYAYRRAKARRGDDSYRLYIATAPDGDYDGDIRMSAKLVEALRLVFKAADTAASERS